MKNIHATCVSINEKGILLLGPSGCGKSDLALRLIEQVGALLVADDRTDLTVVKNKIIATCPDVLKNLLEVRGLGLIKHKSIDNAEISLVVELVDSLNKIERMPTPEYWEFEKIKVKKIKIFPFEASAVFKIKLACDEI